MYDVIKKKVRLEDLGQALKENGFTLDKCVIKKAKSPIPLSKSGLYNTPLAFLSIEDDVVCKTLLLDDELYLWKSELETYISVDGYVYELREVYNDFFRELFESLPEYK